MIIVEGYIRGKQRPRFNSKTRRTYTPQDTVSYENWVRLCYKQQSNKKLEGSIQATIIAYFAVPKSYSKTKRLDCVLNNLRPTKKPDIDNCIKVILDSLNGIAYKDDSQIVEVIAVKKWTEGIERLEFSLEEIKQQNRQSTTI